MSFVRRMSNDILRLNIRQEPELDPNTVCKTYPDLSATQYNLCRRYPDVTASAIQGVMVAVHECQHQLRSYRWNCSSLETKNKNPHSNLLFKKGNYSSCITRIAIFLVYNFPYCIYVLVYIICVNIDEVLHYICNFQFICFV